MPHIETPLPVLHGEGRGWGSSGRRTMAFEASGCTERARPPTPRGGKTAESARVEFDDQVRLHMRRIRHFRQPRNAGHLRRALGMVDFDVIGNVAFGERGGLQHDRQLPRGFLDLDEIPDLDLVGGDVDAAAIDADMAVIDELTRGEDGRHEFGAVHQRIEAALQQADQMGAGIAPEAQRLHVVLVELTLGDITVIALDLLLGLELGAEVGGFALAALAVLAGTVLTLVERAPGTTPDILAHAAVDLIFCFCALRNRGPSEEKLSSGNAPSSASTSRFHANPTPTGLHRARVAAAGASNDERALGGERARRAPPKLGIVRMSNRNTERAKRPLHG